MNNNVISVLNILPYDIPVDLFTEKIGTGDYLSSLIKDNYATMTSKGIHINESFLQQNKVDLSTTDIYELHTKVINEFYLPRIKDLIITDFDDFNKNYYLYLNLSYHYQQISKFNESLNAILTIAKKLYYWGKKTELIKVFDQINDNEIDERNKSYKIYYINFIKILSLEKDSKEEIQKNFELLKQYNVFDSLFFEIKNLEGIYYRIFENDHNKAAQIHLQSLETFEKVKTNNDLFAIIGKIYENLSLCYNNKESFLNAKKYLEKATEYLLNSNDIYEIAKLYYFKASLFYEFDVDDVYWIENLKELNEHLSNYRFPDIERLLYNLLSRIELSRTKQLDDYFRFKSHALDCDLVLYQNNFASDFMSIFNTILEFKNSYSDKIIEGLTYPINILKETNFDNEVYFLETISYYLQGKDYHDIKGKIKNTSLLNLIDELIQKTNF